MSIKSLICAAAIAFAAIPSIAQAAPTAFGISPTTDVSSIGCKQIEGTTYACEVPTPNKAFRTYEVTVSNDARQSVCKVSAYTSVKDYDYSALKSEAIFNVLRGKLSQIYSDDFKSGRVPADDRERAIVGDINTVDALRTGFYEIQASWSGSIGNEKLPKGASIVLAVKAPSSSQTYVSLEYYFGGVGCFDQASEGTEGL